MKSISFTSLIVLVACFLSVQSDLLAQRTISGTEIISMLNDGKDVDLKSTTVTGNLDFSKLNDQEIESKKKPGSQSNYRCHVRNRLSFDNCTFEGKILAYFPVENEMQRNYKQNTIYNTDFHEAVVFNNCVFEKDALFKYSRFYEVADFSGTEFSEEALFKYTKFEESIDFSNSEFGDEADFKYTKFEESVDFTSARFTDFANFKYTEFPGASRLTNAVFERKSDFKYAEFSRETDLAGIDFKGPVDFKYTKKGGRSYRP